MIQTSAKREKYISLTAGVYIGFIVKILIDIIIYKKFEGYEVIELIGVFLLVEIFTFILKKVYNVKSFPRYSLKYLALILTISGVLFGSMYGIYKAALEVSTNPPATKTITKH